MSFLFPNVLWGLFGLTIPIIIHLFSLRKSKTVEFSYIHHIQALEKKNIKKIQEKQNIIIEYYWQIIFLLLVVVIIVFCHLQLFIMIMIGVNFIGSVVTVLFLC